MQSIRQPAEWESHSAVWTAFPSHADLWQDALPAAREEFTEMCRAIADVDPESGRPRGEQLRVMAYGEESVRAAQVALSGLGAEVFEGRFGDIWFRDTAPIFVKDAQGRTLAHSFGFNGWGGKYVLPHDDEVAAQIVERSGVAALHFDWILEGGSVDSDGEGTCLTTRQCLLNPNRNKGFDEATAVAHLKEALGYQKVLWLDEGLARDHTDGHVDNLARFVGPGRVACPIASGGDDPNAEVFEAVAASLANMTDAKGRKLEVVRIPSPGRVLSKDGEIVPASHMNFYIANTTVVIPIYGTPYDDAAIASIQKLFPNRRAIGCRANYILLGGGSFHCITQNQW